jgi:hypothetical protein
MRSGSGESEKSGDRGIGKSKKQNLPRIDADQKNLPLIISDDTDWQGKDVSWVLITKITRDHPIYFVFLRVLCG